MCFCQPSGVMCAFHERLAIRDRIRNGSARSGDEAALAYINRTFPQSQPQVVPVPVLAGHAGDCHKVTSATVTGKTDVACSCGVSQ